MKGTEGPNIQEKFVEAGVVRACDVMNGAAKVPDVSGLYGWFFDPGLLGLACREGLWHADRRLLYVGIAPARHRETISKTAPSTLRKRIIGNHLRGSAGSSTLRLSLGSILRANAASSSPVHGLRLALGSSRGSFRWAEDGEDRLSQWMAQHGSVTWVECLEPWSFEQALIAAHRLPLNIKHNAFEAFRARLRSLRVTSVREGQKKARG